MNAFGKGGNAFEGIVDIRWENLALGAADAKTRRKGCVSYNIRVLWKWIILSEESEKVEDIVSQTLDGWMVSCQCGIID